MNSSTVFTIDWQAGLCAQLADKPMLKCDDHGRYTYVPVWLIPAGSMDDQTSRPVRQTVHVYFLEPQFDYRQLSIALEKAHLIRIHIDRMGFIKSTPSYRSINSTAMDIVILAKDFEPLIANAHSHRIH